MNKRIVIKDLKFVTLVDLKTYIIILFLSISTNLFSQYNENEWIISASFDAVDLYPIGTKVDAPYFPQGEFFEDLFNVSEHWNLGGPSVSISKLIYKGLYFGTEISINRIKKIEGQDNIDFPFYAGEVFVKKTFYSTKKVRPFLKLGYGISGIDRGLFGDIIPFNQYFSKTLSPGLGVQFRITNHFGFEISSSFNKAIDENGITHLRHKASIYLGIGDRDKDGDGIADKNDKCPDIFGIKLFKGCPDTDGDGLEDADDDCPTEYGYPQNKGCPEGPVKSNDTVYITRTDTVYILINNDRDLMSVFKDVKFESDSYILTKRSKRVLDSVSNYMNTKKELRIRITGHTDSQADFQYNLELSKNRVTSVQKYLKSKGIRKSRINIDWKGENEPIADNRTVLGREINRRVEIIILNNE